MGLPFKVVNITGSHLEVVKSPKHGYGGNMNPCIDCHALMFRIAGKMLEQEGASFVVTGEVLGQRPMSQNRESLGLIASESGLGRLLLRPLSAKCLPQTIPEEKGWVRRDHLMNFRGRSRKPQMQLAHALHIEDYPSPAGGCLLTEKAFSNRLKDLFSSKPEFDLREIEVLKLGRHFRIAPNTKIVVGRNKQENDKIQALSKSGDLILTAAYVPGPTVLVLGNISREVLDLAAALTAAYSDTGDTGEIGIRMTGRGEEDLLMARVRDKEEFRRYMI
jgi:tRNA U34 2-thiouridine synthase MnmA/TrmU